MSNTPRISVIVPVYRVEKYLKRCIDSILNQSEQDFELILVDDGSDDDSPNICDRYAEVYSNTIAIHQENHGTAYSRNVGLDIARGELIAFVDPDDWIHRDYLEILLRSIGDADVCCCGYARVNQSIEDVTEQTQERYSCTCEEALRQDRTRVYIWSKLYRKSFISNTRFITTLSNAQDRAFNAELFAENPMAKCVYIDNKLYYYYQHTNAVTHSDKFTDLPAIGEMISVAEKTKSSALLIYVIEWLCIKRKNGFHIGNPPDYATVNKYLSKCSKLCNVIFDKYSERIKFKMMIYFPSFLKLIHKMKRAVSKLAR